MDRKIKVVEARDRSKVEAQLFSRSVSKNEKSSERLGELAYVSYVTYTPKTLPKAYKSPSPKAFPSLFLFFRLIGRTDELWNVLQRSGWFDIFSFGGEKNVTQLLS